jgi:hypothetical protein
MWLRHAADNKLFYCCFTTCSRPDKVVRYFRERDALVGRRLLRHSDQSSDAMSQVVTGRCAHTPRQAATSSSSFVGLGSRRPDV